MAGTEIDVLDSPAITVRDPRRAFMTAVTRAGKNLVAVGDHGVIVYSEDGGLSWLQASVPVSVPLTSVAFWSETLGWAGGQFGVILNTVDGGKTWRVQLNGIELNQLTMAAAQAPATQISQALGAPHALARAQAFVAGGPDRPFLSILSLSADRIFAFGSDRIAVLSLDGGATWQDWSLQIGDQYSHNLYDAAVIGTDIYVVGEIGLVFRSTDDGQTFPAVTSPGQVTLFGVLGAKDGSVIVFGVAGNGFRSTDGGKTWNVINFGTQDNLTAGRRLSNESILIASEGGGLFLSRDDGATFQPVPGVPPMAIFDFEQTDDTAVILVGSGIKTLPVPALDN